ncbi:MAG TPA: hypothetical protein VKL40_01925 [Candidatus Angelobacter sp.]|nr:hypothetical protein [Candidatus Angelobacter sp.]
MWLVGRESADAPGAGSRRWIGDKKPMNAKRRCALLTRPEINR